MSSQKLRPTSEFLQMHLQEPENVLGLQVTSFSRDPSCHIKTPTWNFYEEIYEQKWYRKGLLITLEEVRTSTFKRLVKDSLLQRGVMSRTLKNPKDQDSRKKGMLSDKPRLLHVTLTAFLGSWVLQPIKDLMSLGTDFKMHANWQERPHYCIEQSARNQLERNQVPRALVELSRSCHQTSNNQP